MFQNPGILFRWLGASSILVSVNHMNRTALNQNIGVEFYDRQTPSHNITITWTEKKVYAAIRMLLWLSIYGSICSIRMTTWAIMMNMLSCLALPLHQPKKMYMLQYSKTVYIVEQKKLLVVLIRHLLCDRNKCFLIWSMHTHWRQLQIC